MVSSQTLESRPVLALQVVSYGISINLVEVTWKGRIKQQFPNPNDYSSFMGDFSSATGPTPGLPELEPCCQCERD